VDQQDRLTRCHECKRWFPDSQIRPANDSPEGPWGWGVCPTCYEALKLDIPNEPDGVLNVPGFGSFIPEETRKYIERVERNFL
jgi:hypothetical protein